MQNTVKAWAPVLAGVRIVVTFWEKSDTVTRAVDERGFMMAMMVPWSMVLRIWEPNSLDASSESLRKMLELPVGV